MSWEHKAGILWPILVETARNHNTLYYSDLAPHIGVISRSVGSALGPIYWYCLNEKLPPLTSIVINRRHQVPGMGFRAWPRDDIESAQNFVRQFQWNSVENPFEHFTYEDSANSLSKKLLQNPDKGNKILQQIQVRGVAQNIFRNALLEAYEYRCSICDLSFVESLDAAHIIPWHIATNSEKISPTNGVLLCANHHRLFDSEWIQISENWTIVHKSDSDDDYGKYDKLYTSEFHGNKIHLPRDEKLWPSPELLQRRLRLS